MHTRLCCAKHYAHDTHTNMLMHVHITSNAPSLAWLPNNPHSTISTVSATQNCRLSVVLSKNNNPLVAYCDGATFDLRVYACIDPSCTNGSASPSFAPNVGNDLALPGTGGTQLTILMRPCGSSRPIVLYVGTCISQ